MQDITEDVGEKIVAESQMSLSPSLPEVHRSIRILKHASPLKKILAYSGPGYLISVGYMDPGNWATGISAGAKFGYTLLSIVLLSTIFAIFLQALAAKLGIVTGRDLAQACKDHYSPTTSFILWIMSELAITACDLAEVLGCAVAIKLLFGLPLLAGVLLTLFDVLIILVIQGYSFRLVEAFVIILIASIAACFTYEIFLSQPIWHETIKGFIPTPELLKNHAMLYSAIAILGATIMPHNLYLHSSIVQTRDFGSAINEKKEALRCTLIDSGIALGLAFFINAAIVILSASLFNHRGLTEVIGITEAHQLLNPLLGTSLGSVLFAFALLASGQNSTLTGTLAGQIVMEGFLRFRLRPWQRRLLTRMIAILPAILVISIAGEGKITALLILSQVILSFQLPFAILPLITFTSDAAKMGSFVNSQLTVVIAWTISILIIILNITLIGLIL